MNKKNKIYKKVILALSIITILILSVNIFADVFYEKIEAEKINVKLVLKEMENSRLITEYRDVISLIKYEDDYYVAIDTLNIIPDIEYTHNNKDNEIIIEKNKETGNTPGLNYDPNNNDLISGKSKIVEFKIDGDICAECEEAYLDEYNGAYLNKSDESSLDENGEASLAVLEQGIMNVNINSVIDKDKIETINKGFIQKMNLNINEIESIKRNSIAYRSFQVFDDNDITNKAIGIIRAYYFLNDCDNNKNIKSQLLNYNAIECKFGTDIIQVAYNIKLRNPNMDERKAQKLERKTEQENILNRSKKIIHDEKE